MNKRKWNWLRKCIKRHVDLEKWFIKWKRDFLNKWNTNWMLRGDDSFQVLECINSNAQR